MQRSAIMRLFAAVCFFVAFAGLVVAITISSAFQHRSPELALALWPWNAEARGSLAGRRALANQLSSARQLARRAVHDSPGDAVSLRALGVSEELSGRPVRAASIMELATAASRRDVQTNLWFIEHYVSMGKIASAVRYYDYTLRISAESEQLLFPVLVPAMNEPEIAREVQRRLKSRPVWLMSFFQYAFASGAADQQLVPIVVNLYRDSQGLPPALLGQFAQRLAERANFPALALLGLQTGHPMIEKPGSIAAVGDLPPIDWTLLSGSGFATYPERESGLSFVTSQNAVLAERLIHLPPGGYTFRMQAKRTDGQPLNGLRLSIACAPNGSQFTHLANGAPAKAVLSGDGCHFQKLTISIEDNALEDGAEVSGIISPIEIGRL